MKWIHVLLVTLFMTNFTYAMAGKGKDQNRAEIFKKELNLNDEQLAKVQEIRKKHKGEMRAGKKELKESREAFKAAKNDPKTSNEDLTAKFEAFQKLRSEHQRRKFNMMLEMRSVLKPEQLEKFKELRKNHKKKKSKK